MRPLEETVNLIAAEHLKFAESVKQFSDELRDFKEANRIAFEELHELQRKNEENLKKTDDRWGKLVESLVNNQIVPLLQSRNIPVNHTLQRVGGCVNGSNFEFDVIAVNGESIVVFEVKTTLRVKHVKHFVSQLANLKIWLPYYSDKKIYGGVAFLHDPDKAALYAEKRGLFTILATGSGASITNASEFKPRAF